ncbi:methyl-accepting chemotaxis protein [Kamptonema sp. UHCC 0994]|uniref:methyl-accepting chemotaxis protein n=1 Tax=Kamptonema sp. UHCC 0994 TaxID=3031329 RepID=UPI0023B90408|nr:methyl-accepting chemotaxis protein [Kamptonema sp. UHCC 0994]MDF0553814.1 methyl-accepting chemotaxis protein [Kamptonema sp. UHCC 0994]
MFKNMSLQTRLVSAFLFIGSLVLIVGIIGWSGSTKLSSDLVTIGGNAFPSTVSLWKVNEAQTRVNASDKALIIVALTLEQRQQELKKIEDAFKDINDGFSVYDQLPRTSEEDKIHNKLKSIWDTWTATQKEFEQLHNQFIQLGIVNPGQVQLDLALQGRINSPEFAAAKNAGDILQVMRDQSFRKLDPAYETATNMLLDLLQFNEKLAENATESAKKDSASILFVLGLSVLIAPIIAILFGWYFSNIIAKPLGAKIARVVEVAEKISTGDLTTSVRDTGEQDEVGKLETAFRTMTENLSCLIRQVQQSGIQITSSATQIAASGKELEATITEQVASTNQVAATARLIAATSGQLVKTMDEVEHTSQVTGQSAGESQKDLMQMEKTMRKLAEATGNISLKLGVINDKANSINSIVTTITKVADQTNLLSLNAAIEAEKAGEYGTGFAVVAREIRRLADQTAVATLDIENMVKEMQGAVSTGVMEMDKFTKNVEGGVEDVRNIGEKLESIIRQVQTLTPSFKQVSNSMEDQSQGAQQISEAMVQLSEASSQTAESLGEINGAISQLNEAAQGLRQEISRFKVATA